MLLRDVCYTSLSFVRRKRWWYRNIFGQWIVAKAAMQRVWRTPSSRWRKSVIQKWRHEKLVDFLIVLLVRLMIFELHWSTRMTEKCECFVLRQTKRADSKKARWLSSRHNACTTVPVHSYPYRYSALQNSYTLLGDGMSTVYGIVSVPGATCSKRPKKS